ncbi:MAG: MFS transporter [Alphaproteobacteria bacterium]|nr:MFS transporter [Alphaproteobacteria bacterium]
MPLQHTGADAIDVTELIDSRRLGVFQIRVVALCASVVLIDGFDVQAITYAAPVLTGVLGIERAMLGPVFSAGLFGLTLGAFGFGLLADRLGRKTTFVACAVLFGLCTLATATVGSVTELLAWRFVAGLALGGATPIAVALSSEYCPKSSRETLVMIMYGGFSVGAAGGGFLSAWLIPAFGWRSVFVLGGIVPLAIVPLLLMALPESIRFLVARNTGHDRVAAIVRRLAPGCPANRDTRFLVGEENPAGFPVRHLFSGGRARRTALLWLMFFANLIALYFLINWFPTLIHAAGLPLQQAVIASALIQIGSIAGMLLLAAAMRRVPAFVLLALGFLLGALSFAGLAWFGTTLTGVMAGAFVAGFFVIGTQTGANAVSAMLYPTSIRSTGIGWAIGIGRAGSILGPLIGGVLLSLHWSTASLFLIAAVPAAVAAVAALAIARLLDRAAAAP